MIAIKEAQPNELNIIQDIARRTWPVTYGDILRAEQIAYMLDRFYSTESLNANLDDGHHFLLARENDVVLGFASFVHDAPEKSNTKIPKIYVLPQTQGKGIGWQFIRFNTIIVALPVTGILSLYGLLTEGAVAILAGALGYAFGRSASQES